MSSVGRRPRKSLIGPATSCPPARPSIDVVIVSCTAHAGAERSRAIDGRPGR